MSIIQYQPEAVAISQSDFALHRVFSTSNLPVAAPITIDFLSCLSAFLLEHPNKTLYPELVSLGFWLRRRHMMSTLSILPAGTHRPLGLVVHYSPSNVDTMFVYSWVCSLVMGNRNVVRISQAEQPLKAALLKSIYAVLTKPEFSTLLARNVFIYVDKDNEANGWVSQQADGRVIWGGDESVLQIRALPSKPRTVDVSFADRYSVSVIDSTQLTARELSVLTSRFWQDTKPFSQQACSSPRVIYWLGDERQAQTFIGALNHQVKQEDLAITTANEQLVFAQYCLAHQHVSKVISQTPICALMANTVSQSCINSHPGHYCLLIVPINSVAQCVAQLDEKVQTITYFGTSKQLIEQALSDSSCEGGERVVAIGEALNFSPIWDGVNLYSTLSRQISLN